MPVTPLTTQLRGQLNDALATLDQIEAEQPAPPPPPPPAPGKKIGRLWVGIFNTDLFDYSKSAKYSTFISHYFDSWTTQGLKFKQSNPNGSALVYCNIGNAGGSSSIDLATARSRGFLAHDKNGAEIPNPWGGSMYVMDYGKTGAADYVVTQIAGKLGTNPWDGIFADDVNAWYNLWSSGKAIYGYNSPADYWQRAMLPLLQKLAARWYVIPNIGDWNKYPSVLNSGALACAGGMEEHFLVLDTGVSLLPATIENQFNAVRACVDSGKVYHAVTHLTDQGGIQYAWAMAAIMAGDYPDLFRLSVQKNYGSDAPVDDLIFDTELSGTGIVNHQQGSTFWQRKFDNGMQISADTGSKTFTIS